MSSFVLPYIINTLTHLIALCDVIFIQQNNDCQWLTGGDEHSCIFDIVSCMRLHFLGWWPFHVWKNIFSAVCLCPWHSLSRRKATAMWYVNILPAVIHPIVLNEWVPHADTSNSFLHKFLDVKAMLVLDFKLLQAWHRIQGCLPHLCMQSFMFVYHFRPVKQYKVSRCLQLLNLCNWSMLFFLFTSLLSLLPSCLNSTWSSLQTN